MKCIAAVSLVSLPHLMGTEKEEAIKEHLFLVMTTPEIASLNLPTSPTAVVNCGHVMYVIPSVLPHPVTGSLCL